MKYDSRDFLVGAIADTPTQGA